MASSKKQQQQEQEEQQEQQGTAYQNVAVKIGKKTEMDDVPTVVVAQFASVHSMYKMMGFITEDTEVLQVFEKFDENNNRISGKDLFAGKRVIGRVPFYMLTEAHSYVNINIHKGDGKSTIENTPPKQLLQRASIPVEYKINSAEVNYDDLETDHVIYHSKWFQTFFEFLAALEMFNEEHEGHVWVTNRANAGDVKNKYLYSNNCPFTLIAAAKAYIDLNFPGFRLNSADNFTVEDALDYGRMPEAYTVSRIRVLPIRGMSS